MSAKSTKKDENSTPLMRQYLEIKSKYPDVILLYRMGDFYETFGDDAKVTSKVLGITLTSRSNGKAAKVPLAGFPYHALDAYLYKYMQAGLRVAICEQVEDPKQVKGIVKRQVVEVATPGSAMSEQFLTAKESNYLVCVYAGNKRIGLSFLDVSTGKFSVLELQPNQLRAFLAGLAPREILLSEDDSESESYLGRGKWLLTRVESWVFNTDFALSELTKQFKTQGLKGFGMSGMKAGMSAAGAILYYLQSYQGRDLKHITGIQSLSADDWMTIDDDSLRNLELFRSLRGGDEGTLISALDESVTSGGGRLLRDWLHKPLLDKKRIENRLDQVQLFFDHSELRQNLREILKQIADLERLLSKLSSTRGSARDLAGLRSSILLLPELAKLLDDKHIHKIGLHVEALPDVSALLAELERLIVDEPPVSVKNGGLIRDGIDPELDEIRGIARNAKAWLVEFQATERQRLGISSLKIGYNRVFGYYIDITNTHKDLVPEDYIRKQTLVNSERFITEELKEYEEKVLHAEERYTAREFEIFDELRIQVMAQAVHIQSIADFVARLDVVSTFAKISYDRNYCRPELNQSLQIEISNGRHPVIEQLLPVDEAFIPNDLLIDASADQILLITGPNMAGKSTYLRQIGLLVLLAQIGCYIPADKAKIGMVDRIFTRVGASDNLAGGESTFLVEMNETANILNNATQRSLILLDEIGRGTSTYDGLAIAWALIEYLHGKTEQAARTLFATHYHELTKLEGILPRLKNYNVAVREYDEKVIFLRKIVPGGASRSYGIHVAQMAGVPLPVIQRANEILSDLDSGEISVRSDEISEAAPTFDTHQMTLFDKQERILRDKLKGLKLDQMTPLEAMVLLDEMAKSIGDDN
ncbi:MAG: DNA mismatch repair protein MutS [Candidatus Marinimicrobia bacterium]|jgi:DNA mismatch repair protein MutS|nr:DNA mismatch repair protein MutS [Candidatus Neomarinimicrobiota bacterium]MBT3575375.1 DNA mismatch repair protein MutS [Candidatus Neomarinimicrobiota bacterium]MBT3950350.1 DNA mismatch repair protein MutS [Candidatus Neomarinimicrobiota bacterium]MBT4251704.1 DNA mismatch repair protein MutS [Candidatus Neomarinimicrobiota bacterium]MBT4479574.1 DNA mismatch repair protein MutS [Candidatus Neomarinimicrobiota bacterium]